MLRLVHRHRGPLLLIITASLIVGIVATWNGISYLTDGVAYLIYARALLHGQGLTAPISTYQSLQPVTPLTNWPPLYPVFLALGGGSVDFARSASVGLLALAGILTYSLGLTVLDTPRQALAAALLYVTLPAASEVYSTIWSETLFIVLALAALSLMARAYRLGVMTRSLVPALAAGLLGMLAALTRYIGVTLALSLFLYSLLWAWQLRPPASLRVLIPAVIFVLALLPLGLFVLYLRAETGTLTGTQVFLTQFSLKDVWESALEMLRQMLHGFVLVARGLGLKSNWWVLLIGIVLGSALAARLWPERRPLFRNLGSSHLLLSLFLISYLAFFVISSVGTPAVVATPRHFLVLYPLLLIFALQLLAAARIPRAILAGVFGLYVVSGMVALQEPADGLHYHAPRWRNNPILASLPDAVPDGTVLHEMRAWYVGWRVPDTPVRIFGGDAAFGEHRCDDVRYLPGYPYAGFVLIDSPMLRTQSHEDVQAFFRTWAEPCGTVDSLIHDDFALLMVVRLTENEAASS